MKLQRYKPRHKKQNTFVMRISLMASVFAKQLKVQFKKSAVQAATFLMILSMATVAAGEYGAPFAKAVRDREASRLGLEDRVIETTLVGGSDEQNITLSGYMPENSSAEVIDVTEAYQNGIKDASVLAAFDISIKDQGDKYQPNELFPITVEINDLGIKKTKTTQLWHFKDDGTREVIKDFSLKNGKLSFSARGFSVYSIVDISAQPHPPSTFVSDLSEVIPAPGEDPQGFYLSYMDTSGIHHRFTSEVHTSQRVLYERPDPKYSTSYDEAKWYFEQVGDTYRIYTIKSGTPNYITIDGTNGTNGTTGYLKLTSNPSDPKIALFEITEADSTKHTFAFKTTYDSNNYWLQHSKGGGGIRYWNDIESNNSQNWNIYIAYSLELPDDELGLDGNTYGIMSYPGGTSGFGLNSDPASVDMPSLTVRKDSGIDTLYVDEEDEMSMWTFHNVSGHDYKLSTEVGGVTKWLKLGSSSLSVVNSESEASVISVNADTKNRLQFSSGGKSIKFDNNVFTVADTSGSDTAQWLYLVNLSSLTNDDYVTYYADKVSVSEVPDGSSVIVYTRVWNDYKKQYDFYAIDHDGTLYPCYERGDSIMWLGGQINTLAWDFTEYHNDDGTPNNYYELFNDYSNKYIAPLIEDNQVLSDNKIGISLTGRRNGEYYSDIVAWDDIYYAYSGLQADVNDRKVISGPKAEADTFYFATIPQPATGLTEVETVDHERYGVIMKMVDFPDQSKGTDPDLKDKYQDYFLQATTFVANRPTTGILSNYLGDDGYPTVANTESEKYGTSLSVLYNDGYPEYTKSYDPKNVPVNHIFLESTFNATGYFEFDNCQNFATL
ncbi:MAG: hypothetical protein II742_06595, partial [Clostridia bacterium]|nr:hypothetical protein [Clostridia bacterium]